MYVFYVNFKHYEIVIVKNTTYRKATGNCITLARMTIGFVFRLPYFILPFYVTKLQFAKCYKNPETETLQFMS